MTISKFTPIAPIAPITPVAMALAAGLFTGAMIDTADAARLDVRRLTCDQVRNLVYSRGAIVMTLTNTTYEKIVRNRHFCDPGQGVKPKYSRTIDYLQCNIGKVCTDDPFYKY